MAVTNYRVKDAKLPKSFLVVTQPQISDLLINYYVFFCNRRI